MTNLVKLLSLISAVGVVTGCSSALDFDAAKNANEIVEESDTALDADLEADEAALALSISVAEKSKKGAIVVEKSIYLSLANQILPAVYPPPKGKTCLVQAGTHLINLKQSGENSFSAEVSYHGLKIALNRISCKQGEIVSVRAGSGFRGLAVVTSKQATFFAKELVYIPLLAPLDPVKPVCDLPPAKPKQGAIEASGAQEDAVTTVRSGADYTSPALCMSPDGTGCGQPPAPPEPPVMLHKCAVITGRQNIKLNAIKGNSYISGTAVAAREVSSPVWYADECQMGEILQVDSKSLSEALGYATHSRPNVVPKPGASEGSK